MKKQVTQTLWTCDYYNCKARATSWEPIDTPSGWTSITGSLQDNSGGGPAEFDLCPQHSKTFHARYTVHTENV